MSYHDPRPRLARLPDALAGGGLAALGLMALVALAAFPAAAEKRPVVKVFATGGTIANTPDGRIAVEAIIEELPEVDEIAELRVEDITRVGSSALTWQEFIDTAKAIERTFAEETDVDAALVTIGSNASEDIAYFLNLVLDTDKPVVVTAAQRQRTTRSEDSSRNFIDAVITAASPEAAGKGVLLVANELIHPAREVTKNVVSRVDTWESLDTGALGIVSDGQAVFYRAPLRRHTSGSEFSLDGIENGSDLPKVAILYSYLEAGPEAARAAVEDAGAAGLVVAAYATGTAHLHQREYLEGVAREQGIPVVIANRGSSGRIGERDEPYLSADNLTPQKAHILLTLALTTTDDFDEIKRIFAEY